MKANDLYSFQLGNYKADTEEEHQQLREEAAKGSFIPLENNLKYTSRMYTYDDLTFENVYNDLMNFYSKYVPSSGEFEHNEPDFHNIFLRATLFIHPEGRGPNSLFAQDTICNVFPINSFEGRTDRCLFRALCLSTVLALSSTKYKLIYQKYTCDWTKGSSEK